MADKTAEQQKIGEVLKEFAANVTTSKTKERCRILGELEECVLTNGRCLLIMNNLSREKVGHEVVHI